MEGLLPPHLFRPIFEELEATPALSDDALLLIASKAFQTFLDLKDCSNEARTHILDMLQVEHMDHPDQSWRSRANINLPNEIWCMIFSYLPSAPKKNAIATCKLWSRLIRGNPKLSGHILISWYNMKTALETFQWNWSNWPGLKILELNKLELVEDSRMTSVQMNLIRKLYISLKDHCPPSLEAVLFDVDLTPIQLTGESLLKYQANTNKIFGFGQELDSFQKWDEYASNMRALMMLKSFGYMTGRNRRFYQFMEGLLPPHMFRPILEELEATPVPSNDALILIASPAFQTFRPLCDRVMNYLKAWPEGSEPFGFSSWSQFQGLRVNNETLRCWNKLVAKYGD